MFFLIYMASIFYIPEEEQEQNGHFAAQLDKAIRDISTQNIAITALDSIVSAATDAATPNTLVKRDDDGKTSLTGLSLTNPSYSDLELSAAGEVTYTGTMRIESRQPNMLDSATNDREIHLITDAPVARFGTVNSSISGTLGLENVVISGDLAVNGTTTTVNIANLDVTDKNITLNKNGLALSGGSAGLEIEEGGSITSYLKVSEDRSSWLAKAPNGSEFALGSGADTSFTSSKTFTLNKGGAPVQDSGIHFESDGVAIAKMSLNGIGSLQFEAPSDITEGYATTLESRQMRSTAPWFSIASDPAGVAKSAGVYCGNHTMTPSTGIALTTEEEYQDVALISRSQTTPTKGRIRWEPRTTDMQSSSNANGELQFYDNNGSRMLAMESLTRISVQQFQSMALYLPHR